MVNSSWRLSPRVFLIPLLLLTAMAWVRGSDAAQLSLSWIDNSTNEDGFKIERRTTDVFAQIAMVEANISAYTDSTLAAGTTYCYRVRAFNTAGDAADSNENCGTTTAVESFTLTATKAGSGSGTVSSSPAGIACGADCSEPYLSGTTVTLTATPAADSTFTGWSGGGCSGTGPCTVIVTANTAVTATFAQQMNVKIGVFRPSTGRWYLDLNGNGVLDACTVDACLAPFGQQGSLPVVGDWAGTGTIQIGVFEPSTRWWKLDRNGNDRWDGCTVDLCLGSFGKSGDRPVVGDWTGFGPDRIGFYRPSEHIWRLDRNGNGKLDSCTVDGCLGPFGLAGDLPVVGDWSGTGIAKLGVFDPSTGLWELDLNDNGLWDGCGVDACLGPFGQQGDLPVVGKW